MPRRTIPPDPSFPETMYHYHVYNNQGFTEWRQILEKYDLGREHLGRHRYIIDLVLDVLEDASLAGFHRAHGPVRTSLEQNLIQTRPTTPQSLIREALLMRTYKTVTTASYAHLETPALLLSVYAESEKPSVELRSTGYGARDKGQPSHDMIRLTVVSREAEEKEARQLTEARLACIPIFTHVDQESGPARYARVVARSDAPFIEPRQRQ